MGIRNCIILDHRKAGMAFLEFDIAQVINRAKSESLREIRENVKPELYDRFITHVTSYDLGYFGNVNSLEQSIDSYGEMELRVQIGEITPVDLSSEMILKCVDRLKDLRVDTFFVLLSLNQLKDSRVVELFTSLNVIVNVVVTDPIAMPPAAIEILHRISELSLVATVQVKSNTTDGKLPRFLRRITPYDIIVPTRFVYDNFILGHPAFNQRIHVLTDGRYSNSYSDLMYIGNVYSESNEYILQNLKTNKYWLINRENVELCCDCEFRAACIYNSPLVYDEKESIYRMEAPCQFAP